MTDTAELVKRLRKPRTGGVLVVNSLNEEAADALEAQEREIALIKAERGRAQQACEQMGARIARLREALEKIANVPDDIDAPYYPTQYARDALKGDGKRSKNDQGREMTSLRDFRG